MKRFFCGVRLREPSTSKPNGSISLVIDDNYLCSVIILTCKLNDYPYDEEVSEKEKIVIEKLSNIDKRKRRRGDIPFDNAIESVDEDVLLETLGWFENQVEFAIKILRKTEKIPINNKKRVSSILDSL